MRKGVLFFVCLVLFASLSYAEEPSTGLTGQLEDANAQLDEARGVIEGDRWLLGEEWKAFMLENKVIGGANAFLTRFDTVFVVLFARHYDLSLTLFFAFLLWLFTIIWMSQAVGGFFAKGWIRVVLGCALTIVLAHAQLFNRLSTAAYTLMTSKTSAAWSFVIFMVVCAFTLLYLYGGYVLGKYLTGLRVAREARLQKLEVSLLATRAKSKDKAMQEE